MVVTTSLILNLIKQIDNKSGKSLMSDSMFRVDRARWEANEINDVKFYNALVKYYVSLTK